MNNPITKGYVEGYKDATVNIHASIKDAVVRGGINKKHIIDTIIENMYLQNDTVKELRHALEAQMEESDDVFEEYK